MCKNKMGCRASASRCQASGEFLFYFFPKYLIKIAAIASDKHWQFTFQSELLVARLPKPERICQQQHQQPQLRKRRRAKCINRFSQTRAFA